MRFPFTVEHAIFFSVGCQEIEQIIFFVSFAWTELKFVSFVTMSFIEDEFQMRIVPSQEQEARRSLSALQYCRPKIVSKWPFSVENSIVCFFKLQTASAPFFRAKRILAPVAAWSKNMVQFVPLLPILFAYLGSFEATFQYCTIPSFSFVVTKFPDLSGIQTMLFVT